MQVEYEIRRVWISDGLAPPRKVWRVYDVTAGRLARVAEFETRRRAVAWVMARRG